MPEGPEIRRVADRLSRALAGRPATEVWFAFEELESDAAELSGRVVERVDSWGKAILTRFAGGRVVYSHNQLYGRWYVKPAGQRPETGRQLRLAIHNHRKSALLYSASDIAVLDADRLDEHPFLARLGPDVLSPGLDRATVAARLGDERFRRRQLAALLLDQGFVAGLGNYLRAEILHASGIHPRRRPADLDDDELERLAGEILAVTRQSFQTGGVTNDLELVERLKAEGKTRSKYRFRVYQRDGRPCYRCGEVVVRDDAGGRGMFHCPFCQPAIAQALTARTTKRSGPPGTTASKG